MLTYLAAPVSTFSRSRLSSRQPVLETNPVEMRKIRCVVEADTGHTELVAVGETLTGQLSVKPFARGTMKQVHSVSTFLKSLCSALTPIQLSAFFNSGSMRVYAAKRFFKLEEHNELNDVEELPKVPVLDNNSEIVCELVRIALGQFFLREFYSFAKNVVEAVVDTSEYIACCIYALLTKCISQQTSCLSMLSLAKKSPNPTTQRIALP